MPFLVLFAMLALPVLEVASIVAVSSRIGIVPTLLLLASFACLGVFLVRSQSLTIGNKLMHAARQGIPPEKPLLDSGTVALAGMLFMVPGFITDAVAAMMLIPGLRRRIWQAAAYGFRRNSPGPRQPPRPGPDRRPPPPRQADVIDVEFTDVPPRKTTPPAGDGANGSPWRKG